MKKILILLMLLLLPLVFAQQAYMKTDVPGTIEFPCYNNTNGKCVAGTLCNISITDPEGTRVVTNQQTTLNVDLYHYDFTPTKVGDYQVFLYCYSSSDTGFSNFIMQSNNHGRQITNYGAILALTGIIILLIIALMIFAVIKHSIWTYPLLIVLAFAIPIFFYVWWSYSIIMSDILYVLWQISFWFAFPAVLFCLFELGISFWDWLSRRKQGNRHYQDTF